MDRPTARRRWDELAAWVAEVVDRGPDPDLEALVTRLELAFGLVPLTGPDPSGAVTARRFARVHAAAMRAHGPALQRRPAA